MIYYYVYQKHWWLANAGTQGGKYFVNINIMINTVKMNISFN